MSYCPVCNGLSTLSATCSSCSAEAYDCGRFNDYLGPYSPYRDIDAISASNGYADLRHHVCMHVVRCGSCRREFTLAIPEWR